MTAASLRGGLVTVMETLAAAQSGKHEVVVIAPLRPRSPVLANQWRHWKSRGNSDIASHMALASLLRSFRADTVILHAGSPGELSVAAALVSCGRTALVVEHLAEHYPLHSLIRGPVLGYLKKRATEFVSVSEAGATALKATLRLRPANVHVVLNGVVRPRATPVPGSGDAESGRFVVGLGRLEARKGFDTFARVAAALADQSPFTNWLWVGGETEERRGCVQILPWQDTIGGVLEIADLLLMPSLAEGLPLTLLEAWSYGVAVVASRVGGIPEVVQDGCDGVLVAPGDPQAWVEAVAGLLARPDLRRRIGEAGRIRWQADFTAQAMAGRYERLLGGLWSEREDPR